jgi:predicted nuclease of predicted toxin-antitoxin system
MNLIADESVHRAIIDHLRAEGHTVRAIAETNQGAADADVLTISINEQVLLLTQDKDFGEMVVRHGMNHCGIVLIRLAGISVPDRARQVSELLRDHSTELSGAFTVISPGGVRTRRIGPP